MIGVDETSSCAAGGAFLTVVVGKRSAAIAGGRASLAVTDGARRLAGAAGGVS